MKCWALRISKHPVPPTNSDLGPLDSLSWFLGEETGDLVLAPVPTKGSILGLGFKGKRPFGDFLVAS